MSVQCGILERFAAVSGNAVGDENGNVLGGLGRGRLCMPDCLIERIYCVKEVGRSFENA